MKIGRLLLRLAVGGFFIGHGTQKLFGWFGGYGLEGTAQGFESLGLRPGKRHAIAAGAAEAGGGALIALGAATPVAASVLTATMLTAINRAHLKNGPWATNGGYEYNVVLIAAVLALAETGPGSPSVDAALGSERHGPKWAAWALLAGVAGAATAHAIAEATDAPEPAAEPETESQGEVAQAEENTPA
ncbi:MAG TPA: DoxX family protein [Solirubrobacteraceae bacterium]|jgi:putative oxidoreductase|nr:DoxX family protein [Solirubrobacteraceae bacterium]